MLSQLDNIIFPDRCDVLEIVPSQRYVYPIYKNGSSSLYHSGFRLLENDELENIKVVDIYVRNPYDRFVTGVNTFLQHNQDLDRTTILYFINNYLFLNRHFCPQFHWLVNLQRFTRAKIRINSIDTLSGITRLKVNQSQDPLLDECLDTEKLHFYLSVDKVLTEDLLGQVVSFRSIVETLANGYPEVYKEVVQRSLDLCNVLD
jgi:hypothetical protein